MHPFLHSSHLLMRTTIMVALLLTCCANLVSTKGNVGAIKRHMNYVAFENPPFDRLIRKPNGTVEVYGPSPNILQWLSVRYQFTYSLASVNQTLEAKYGTHEAVFYQLINDKDVDGIVCSFYITLDRKERMDFAQFPTVYEGFRLVVPRSGEESRLFALIRPFQSVVWLLILITIIVLVGQMTLFALLYNKNCDMQTTRPSTSVKSKMQNNGHDNKTTPFWFSQLTSSMIYVINIMTNQGCRERYERNSFRVLAGFFLLGAMVLVNSYSGIVTSSLTVPKMKPHIDSFEDLAASKDVDVLIRHDTSIGAQILTATSGVYKILGDKARRNPENIIGDPVKLVAKLQTGSYAFPFVSTFCLSFVANQYKKDGKCRFKASRTLPATPGYYYWPTKKGDERAQLFRKGLMDLFESGLVRFWARDAVPQALECLATDKQKTSARKFRLQDLTSAFLIWGIGIGLAILGFSLEHVHLKLKRLKEQR